MAIQLSQARDSLQNYKRDITDVGVTVFVEWCNFVNRFIFRKLKDADPERFITSSTVSVISGTSTYSLPATFRDISVWGCGLFEVDSNGNDTDRQLARTGFGSSSRGFYISGSNIVLTPTPTKAETLKLRFLPKLTTLTALQDYFTLDGTANGTEIIPDEYLDMLVSDLAKLHAMWDEDLGIESYEDERFTRHLDEFLSTIRKEPNVYGLSDFTQPY